MFAKIIFHFLLLLCCTNTILNKNLKESCYLPSGCKFGQQSKDEKEIKIFRINCFDPLVKYDFSQFNQSNEMCRLKQPTRRTLSMSIRANRKKSILDINLDLIKLVEYSRLYFRPFALLLNYYHFKGIHVDTKIDTKLDISISFEISQSSNR